MSTVKTLKNTFSKIVLYSAVWLGTSSVAAQTVRPQETVRLKNTNIPVVANTDAWLNNNSKSGRMQVLLHLKKIATATDKTTLAQSGITLLDYISGHTYTAIIDVNKCSSFPPVVYGVTDIDPVWKMDEGVKAALYNKGLVKLVVSTYNGIADVAHDITAIGGTIESGAIPKVGVYNISIPAEKIKTLAAVHFIKYISLQADPQPLNYQAKTAAKVNIGALSPLYGGYGLSGKGVTVGVGDNVSGNFHIDLKDRIINYNPNAYADHGVHINGIAGGAGIMDIEGEGVATSATLVNHMYSAIWEETPDLYQLHNMTITNNSYAAVIQNCSYSGQYNVYSEAIDKLALEYKDVLHVFAAGNDGNLNCSPYPQGFGTVTGGYQPAKNNIVVTSTTKDYINALDASRGPVRDGRLKPEITAVGVAVNSTTRSEEYLSAGGTSMASPGVAGALALLTERYKQLNGPTNPRADVLKTLLLNGATDMDNPGPDFRFGFGFMNLYRSLLMLDNNNFRTDTVANGEQKSFTVNVPANTAQLKVMLCWHDVPANPMATTQLVNDLDVEVTTPASALHKPLVLDTAAANILNNATEKEDRLNNTEQVVINNPQAGSYTVTVKGFRIPAGNQDYVVAYDFIPVGVNITYPTTAAALKAGDTARVYWDASEDENSFTLEYSTNGGTSWTVIDNSIPQSFRTHLWEVPAGINSGKCLMRLTRNNKGQVFTTGLFAINDQPVLTLDAVQCPGYIRINWAAIPNAATYEVYKKEGPNMQLIGNTSGTTYTFSGLSKDSTYYLALRPVIDGVSGYRSLALKRKPDSGTCAGSISDGDLAVQQLIMPSSGRRFTSTALTTTENIKAVVRNLDDAPANNYRVWYSINSAPWASVNATKPLPATDTVQVSIGDFDFSAEGAYSVQVAVQNISGVDTEHANDSLSTRLKQLSNTPVSLTNPLLIDFENWPIVDTRNDSMGISPDDRWDYANFSDTCRLRSFVKPDITINGSKSISLDATYNTNGNHRNDFTGTFNMGAYNAANEEVRMEFNYIMHSRPRVRDSNMVWIHGNDLQTWVPLHAYNYAAGKIGAKTGSGSISVTDALLNAGQNFSTSTQVRFTQNDVSLISMPDYGSGLTIDDIRLYTVQNDMQLLQVLSPAVLECGLTGSVPLKIKLRNGVNQQQNNVQVSYRLDNNPVVTETIASIAGKQTLDYTFTQLMDMTAKGQHKLDIWVAASGDNYLPNDSIIGYTFHNQPLITSYPYLENFEENDGFWFADGVNSSWEYGKPASPKIDRAAGGEKAWKTNLDGTYNAGELSYLYSPCFDISKLTNPLYRFKMALDIEYCGVVLCDGTAMQYSEDGVNWQPLGKAKEGSNWYNDTLYNIWSKQDATNWQMAAIPLPKGIPTIRLRYIFSSDIGSELEGLAIDDVEIVDDIPVVVDDNLVNVSPNPTRDGKITVEWTTKGGSDLQIAMFDAMGKQVYQSKTKGMAGINNTTLQTPRFSSGVYIMRVIVGDKKFSRKIVYL